MAETTLTPELFESPETTPRLMERVCEWRNMDRAMERVMRNKGRPGLDGMSVQELVKYVDRHHKKIRRDLLDDRYRPSPVQRLFIPKPNGGKRPLGIPTVMDRMVQQMLVQILTGFWEPTFSNFSFGFRPGRSQHDAIRRAHALITQGKTYCVVIDLAQFFDRVNQDRLMSRVARRITDKRVLRLIRGFLTSGVLYGGITNPTLKGVPQGGPLSPLLSNIVLDELDHELERRGLDFVRYADDVVIFVKSAKAGTRVLTNVSRYIQRKLKLQVNAEKSGVYRPWEINHLGVSFKLIKDSFKINISRKSLQRFKTRIREITGRSRGRSIRQVIAELRDYQRGWWAYFGRTDDHHLAKRLCGWIRRRLRSLHWKQWRHGKTRVAELHRRGICIDEARRVGQARAGIWVMSGHYTVQRALPNRYFSSLGLFEMG